MPNSVDTDIALLREGLSQHVSLVNKLDTTIEKIAGIGNDISKMLALHEQRIDRLERIDQEIHNVVELRRVENAKDLGTVEGKLNAAIDKITKEISATEDRVVAVIKERDAESEKISERVNSLEKWRWMVVGGGAVIGVVASKLSTLLHMSVL